MLDKNQKEHILIQRKFVLPASYVSTILDCLRVIDGNFLIYYYSDYFLKRTYCYDVSVRRMRVIVSVGFGQTTMQIYRWDMKENRQISGFRNVYIRGTCVHNRHMQH